MQQQQPLTLSSLLSLLLLVVLSLEQSLAEHLKPLYTVSESVGAGNFSHIKLYDRGQIYLVLETVSGDADLFVSDTNSLPGWMDYDLQSVTCGEDTISVPADMKRPVYIGIFGHPSNDLSVYVLRIYRDTTVNGEPVSDGKNQGRAPSPSHPEDERESILWNVFVSLLKFLLDVLV